MIHGVNVGGFAISESGTLPTFSKQTWRMDYSDTQYPAENKPTKKHSTTRSICRIQLQGWFETPIYLPVVASIDYNEILREAYYDRK